MFVKFNETVFILKAGHFKQWGQVLIKIVSMKYHGE